MTENLQAGVIECVAQSLAIEPAEVQQKSRLIPDLGADSLDFMDIMFSLERKFGIKLQKEDFDLISRVGMKKEEVIVNGNLTDAAKLKLKPILPAMPLEGELKAKELGSYITVETLMVIVQDFLDLKQSQAQ